MTGTDPRETTADRHENARINNAESWQEKTRDWASSEELTDLSYGWNVKLCRAAQYPSVLKELQMNELVPVSDFEPGFSGIMIYTKDFVLDDIPGKAFFKAENVFEVMRVYVNGKEAGSCIMPPYRVDVSGLLRAGKNTITVEVANTPGRDQLNYPQPPFDFQHDPLEPSGMFGKAGLFGIIRV